MLVNKETPSHKGENDPPYPIPPFETALASSRQGKSTSITEMLNNPASTSADIGLRLLLQAIGERRGGSWYLDSEASVETTTSVDLALEEIPSFLDDICKCL